MRGIGRLSGAAGISLVLTAAIAGPAAASIDTIAPAPVSTTTAASLTAMPALGPLRQADILVIAPKSLPAQTVSRLRGLRGVTAAQAADAARIRVNGSFVAMLGVNPVTFRSFAARPTARARGLWQNVAHGGVALSYQMGQQEKLKVGKPVSVAGTKTEHLAVGGFGTVGIAGVDAVVSDSVARSLGLPAGNAVIVSAPHADLTGLLKRIGHLLPKHAEAVPLVAQTQAGGTPAAGDAGVAGSATGAGSVLTRAQLIKFLTAAESRIGMPYVWGAAGPRAFDCSGLVQWSLAQAGIVMPRVAAAQALTGPSVPVADLSPGDLLFFHTDPTAPDYISHVAIYVGDGKMLQAPQPGMNVEIVPADTTAEFAGAVQIDPHLAAQVAASPVG